MVIEYPGAFPGGVRQAGGEAGVLAHVVHDDGREGGQLVLGAIHADALQQGTQLVLATLQPGLPGQLGVTNGGALPGRLDEDVPQLVVAVDVLTVAWFVITLSGANWSPCVAGILASSPRLDVDPEQKKWRLGGQVLRSRRLTL